MPDDNFSHSLALIEKGSQLDDSPDPGTALSILSQRYSYVFPSTSVLAILSQLGSVYRNGSGHRLLGVQTALDGSGCYRLRSGVTGWRPSQ